MNPKNRIELSDPRAISVVALYIEGKSLSMCSAATGLSISTARRIAIAAGALRSTADAIRLAASQGRMGSGLRGKTWVCSDETRRRMSVSGLRRGESTVSAKRLQLSGQRFARLVVVGKEAVLIGDRLAWACRCDCGADAIITTQRLRNGTTRSCGCMCQEQSLRNIPSNARPVNYERTTSQGYVEVKTETGFRRKHIVVMERRLGRSLLPGEVVHHIDKDKTNNEDANLALMTHAEHTIHHNHERGRRNA